MGDDAGRKPVEKESSKEMIKILFVCWGITFTEAWNLDVSDVFSNDSNHLQLIYNIWNSHDMKKTEYKGRLCLSGFNYQ